MEELHDILCILKDHSGVYVNKKIAGREVDGGRMSKSGNKEKAVRFLDRSYASWTRIGWW